MLKLSVLALKSFLVIVEFGGKSEYIKVFPALQVIVVAVLFLTNSKL
jgi:hypothetical protein